MGLATAIQKSPLRREALSLACKQLGVDDLNTVCAMKV